MSKKNPKKKKARKTKGRTQDSPRHREARSAGPSALPEGAFRFPAPYRPAGPGIESGGQSGDLQGLSQREIADSESVAELLEEGQAHEAEVLSGVENALDPDEGEVVTHEVPQDDVPEEYTEED